MYTYNRVPTQTWIVKISEGNSFSPAPHLVFQNKIFCRRYFLLDSQLLHQYSNCCWNPFHGWWVSCWRIPLPCQVVKSNSFNLSTVFCVYYLTGRKSCRVSVEVIKHVVRSASCVNICFYLNRLQNSHVASRSFSYWFTHDLLGVLCSIMYFSGVCFCVLYYLNCNVWPISVISD